MARWLAFLVVILKDTHRDVVIGEPPLSRQVLAADQSGPPKSPAATLAIIFVFHTPYSYCLSTFPSIKQFCPTGHNALTYARSFLIVGNDNFLLLLTQKNLDVIT